MPWLLAPATLGHIQAGHLMCIVPMFASPAVDTRRSLQCFALLAVDTCRSFAQAAQSRRTYNGICHFFSRDRAAQHNCHHPCWEAAYFLPCTRPPDVLRLHRAQRGRTHHGPSERRAYVSTRSGLHTMPTGHGDAEAATAPVAVTRPRSSSLSPLFYCSFCDRTQFFQASRTSFLLVHPRRTRRRPP